MTNTAFPSRDVARVDSPSIGLGMTPDHRVRPLVPAGNWAATDPFLLLMEDWFPQGVFDRHPHRGIETVTYVIEGRVEHYDNHGNTGTVGPGDAMWLTTGRGLIHNEQPAAGQTVHLLQLWVNLPKADKLVPAHYQDILGEQAPKRREPGVEVRVFSGASGEVESPTGNHASVTMLEIVMDPNAHFQQQLPADYNGFVVVLTGNVAIGASATDVKAGQVAWLTRSESPSVVTLTGGADGVRAILFAGKPLQEPVAARGPFVMNTEDELAVGFSEFRTQGERFGL